MIFVWIIFLSSMSCMMSLNASEERKSLLKKIEKDRQEFDSLIEEKMRQEVEKELEIWIKGQEEQEEITSQPLESRGKEEIREEGEEEKYTKEYVDLEPFTNIEHNEKPYITVSNHRDPFYCGNALEGNASYNKLNLTNKFPEIEQFILLLKDPQKVTAIACHNTNVKTLAPFKPCINIQNLSLDINRVADLTGLFDFKNLTHISLSQNGITTFPSGITALTCLKVLNLSHNFIKDISSLQIEPRKLRHLESLYLHNNLIENPIPIMPLCSIAKDFTLNNNPFEEKKLSEAIQLLRQKITLLNSMDREHQLKCSVGSATHLSECYGVLINEMLEKEKKRCLKLSEECEQYCQEEEEYKKKYNHK